MMDICEVIDECPDGKYTVVMEDCVNKNSDETHTDVSEHDKETNRYALIMVTEECLDGGDDDKNKKIRKKSNT